MRFLLVLLSSLCLVCALNSQATTAAVVGQSGHSPATSPQKVSSRPRVIRISAKQFTFNPSTIRLKKGKPVKLEIVTKDVLHGFRVRELNIDSPIEPGKVTEIELTPTESGTYTVFCSKQCGPGHKDMRMTILVRP